MENNELTSKNIKKYIKSGEKQFKVFDIKYDDDEKQCIEQFNLSNTISYNNYGDNTFSKLENFLNDVGENNSQNILKLNNLIKKIKEIVMLGYEKESFWLTIRVTTVEPFFDIPRWHCDGYYTGFDRRDDLSKFATVLKGPGTLFIKTDADQRDLFINTRKEELDKSKQRNTRPNANLEDDMYRSTLNEKLEGVRLQANNDQAAIFMAGDFTTCGIHSEPKKDTWRMFLSIVPGSKEEIQNWQTASRVVKSHIYTDVIDDDMTNSTNSTNSTDTIDMTDSSSSTTIDMTDTTDMTDITDSTTTTLTNLKMSGGTVTSVARSNKYYYKYLKYLSKNNSII